jgi:alkylation response protein AidB-like acyl-CoA dehydrogenase
MKKEAIFMDIKFSEEQEMIREVFRDFALTYVNPSCSNWDEEDYCPTELLPIMGKLGILGVFVPETYGGVGLNHTERVIAIEEIARYSAGLAMLIFTHQLGIAALMDFGSEEQKHRYLPDLCSGKKLCGLAVTEPSGGSDVMGQKTKAYQQNDNWIINGRKCFITNAGIADLTIITAQTGVSDKGKPELSAFIIEKDRDGFYPGRKEHKLGLKGSVTGEIVMDNVSVPSENLVGKIGKGAAIAMKEIGEVGRASMAAICVGLLKGCLDESVKFSNEHIVYGKPISKLQAIQFHIAENRLDYEAARLLLYRAASLKDAGLPSAVEFSMAKYFGTEAASRAAKRTIELMGGYGIVNEYPAGRFLRDALTSISSGGTGEIQKIIIAADTYKMYDI